MASDPVTQLVTQAQNLVRQAYQAGIEAGRADAEKDPDLAMRKAAAMPGGGFTAGVQRGRPKSGSNG